MLEIKNNKTRCQTKTKDPTTPTKIYGCRQSFRHRIIAAVVLSILKEKILALIMLEPKLEHYNPIFQV